MATPNYSGVTAYGSYSTAGGSSGVAVTAAVTTTIGRGVLLIVTGQQSVAINSITDSKGNTWTQIGSMAHWTQYSTDLFFAAYYCPALTTAGSGHTFTVNTTGAPDGFPSIQAIEFDQGVTFGNLTNQTPTGSTWTPSITTSAANQLVVAGMNPASGMAGGTWTLSATGYTFIRGSVSSSDWALGALCKQVSGSGTVESPVISGADIDPTEPSYIRMMTFAASGGSPDVNVDATGTAATLTQGTATTAIDYTLTGQGATAAQGTATAAVNYTLTGQDAALAQGATSTTIDYTLTGQGATIAQGTASAGIDYALTGQAIAGTQGTVGVQVDGLLTGQAIAVDQGTLATDISVVLTGQALTLDQGTVTTGSDTVVSLTGQDLSLAQGSLVADVSVPMAGQGLSLAQGTVTVASPDVSVAIAGLDLAFGTGQVAFESSDVSVAIVGLDLAFGTGQVAFESRDVSTVLSGLSMGLFTGQVGTAGGLGALQSANRRWAQQFYTKYFADLEAERAAKEESERQAPKPAKAPAPKPQIVKAAVEGAVKPLAWALKPSVYLDPSVPAINGPMDLGDIIRNVSVISRQVQADLAAARADDEDEELLLLSF